MQIDIVSLTSFADLGRQWRALEATAPALSFFQSWTWVGCLAEERYPDPVLLRAATGSRTLGLALFNRRHGRLSLAESGDPALDAPYIEHNAPLLGVGAGPEVAAALLRAVWTIPGVRRVQLSGVPPDIAAAPRGIALRRPDLLAPRVDLAAVRASGRDWWSTLSANTRYQLRRSARHYAERGEVKVARAATPVEASAWLEALMALHAAHWGRRGQPGAFATPYLRRFHTALIAAALPRHEVDLLRVTAGDAEIGYLYNFRLRGEVMAYQSGLNRSGAGEHGKPGLTCHALAIERALAAGDMAYDFLAPADRYKTSLAGTGRPLTWLEVVPKNSVFGVLAHLRRTGQIAASAWEDLALRVVRRR